MAFQWLSQENIRVDWNLNPRERDDDHIRTIASHMNEKGYDAKFPIVVYQFKDEIEAEAKAHGIPVNLYCTEVYHAATGHHRLAASMLQDDEFPNLPLPEVYCEIREGTRSEYVRWMLIDNFQHTPGFNKNIGKMPTRKELQQMRFQLLYFPDVFAKGDRLLSKEWGCDHKTVGEVRSWFIAKLSDGENSPPDHVTETDIVQIKVIIESDLYLGKDGKKYPRTTQAKPPQTDAEREESALRKQKKKIFNQLWESRRAITQIWIGDGDTDLNQYLTVDELERGFIKYHQYCREAFKSALNRTQWSIYDHALKLLLEDDKYSASVDELETELRAMRTFETDVRTWSSSTKASLWIRTLIADKKENSTPTAAPKRYFAQIIHANKDDAPYSHTNELYFPCKEDREHFGEEFAAYHASHEHDGEAPEFKVVKVSELNSGEREQAKRMTIAEEGWETDYDGWFEQELKSKISYFKPTCIIQESPVPESQDGELDADLKKKLTDIFTLHGNIPVYNPSTQESYSTEISENSNFSDAEVYLQIGKFKAHIHNLEKDVRKRIKENPQRQAGSLAIDLQEDIEVVKTIMANIASHQQFLDKQQQGKEETPASAIVPEPAETETPIQFEIDELDITIRPSENGESPIYGDSEGYAFIFINNDNGDYTIADLPEPLMTELTKFVKSHLEKNDKK